MTDKRKQTPAVAKRKREENDILEWILDSRNLNNGTSFGGSNNTSNTSNTNSNDNDNAAFDIGTTVAATVTPESFKNSNNSSNNNNNTDIVRQTLRIYGGLYLGCVLLFSVLRKRVPHLYNVRKVPGRSNRKKTKKMNRDGGRSNPAAAASASTGTPTAAVVENPYSFNSSTGSLEDNNNNDDVDYGWFSWLWAVFQVSDTDLQEQCGMDAVCFLRALRFGRKLSLLGCANALWLIPLYRTATTATAAGGNDTTDPLMLLSVSNVPSVSARFLGTVLAAYITYFYAMLLILKEYAWYTTVKHKFLARTVPRNYAVCVTGIPMAYRSSRELANYFRQLCSNSTTGRNCSTGRNSRNKQDDGDDDSVVLEAHLVVETPKLDQLVARRNVVLQRLEHALAVECHTGRRETHRPVLFPAQGRSHRLPILHKVDSVPEFRDELTRLNRSIAQGVADVFTAMNPHHRKNANRLLLTRNRASKDLLRAMRQDVQADFLCVATDKNSTHSSSAMNEDNELGVVPDDSHCDECLALDLEENDLSLNFEDCRDASLSSQNGHENHSTSAFFETDCDGMDHADLVSRSGNIVDVELHDGDQKEEAALVEWRSSSRSSLKVAVLKSMASGTSVISEGLEKAGKSFVKTSQLAGTAVGSAVAKTTTMAGSAVLLGSRVAGETGAEALARAQLVGSHVLSSAGAVVPLLLPKSEGKPTDVGFVVFTSLYATQSALQMIHHPKPYVMSVIPAANPNDIFWRNVGLPHRAKRSGLVAALAATTVVCFFYSVPMAFITSLTELNSLKESLPKLAAWIDDKPIRERLLAQVAPLILLLFNESILPSVLKYFATWEGHISSAMLEASLFVKLGCFMIIQTFFVSAISGGISAELANILDDPGSLIPFLAKSLPARSSYFIQIVLAQTFFLQSLELLRIYPLGIALLRRCFGPRLTAKERRQRWCGLRTVGDPPDFWHAETFAQLILLYMVFFVYSTIAPISAIFLCFCFVLLESGYRYQFIHNYPRAFDTGGRLWKCFIHFTLASMIISQLTLIGLLGLKKSPYAGPAMGPLLAITTLFIIFINSKHSKVCEHLPTRDCILKDRENSANGMLDMSFVEGVYLHPSLQNNDMEPDYDNDDLGQDVNLTISERIPQRRR